MFWCPYYTKPVVSLSGYSIPCLAFQSCSLLTTLERVALLCGGLTQGDLFLFLWMTFGKIRRAVQWDVYRSAFSAVAGLPLEPGGNKHDTHYNQSGWWRNPSSHSCLVQLSPLVSAVLLYITVTGILCSWQLTREIFLLVSESTVQGCTVNCLEVRQEEWRWASSPASVHTYMCSRCVWCLYMWFIRCPCDLQIYLTKTYKIYIYICIYIYIYIYINIYLYLYVYWLRVSKFVYQFSLFFYLIELTALTNHNFVLKGWKW
jgi:hypothetical protein